MNNNQVFGQNSTAGQSMIETRPVAGPKVPAVKTETNKVAIIIVIILSILVVTFIGLFIWKTIAYNEVKTDVNSQISIAVAKAVDEKTTELELEFAEREKNPYNTFAGPVDYGELSFEYPKTWSVYIESDASKGGDFSAYFNPKEVETVSKDSINALRLTISTKSFESVVAEYQRTLSSKDSKLSVSTMMINGTTANVYSGKIPGTDLNGYIVIFKIRDKSVILRTDSTLFTDDFNKVISSIDFNA